MTTGTAPDSAGAGVDARAGGVGQEVLAAVREVFARRCRVEAELLALLHEAGRSVAGSRSRLAVLDEFSDDEVAALLGWSRSGAGRVLGLADDLLVRLPEVHAAMAAGGLEQAKARVFSDWTADLCDDHAHHVCTELLESAPTMPVADLIAEIQRVAVALDPGWAQRRLDAAAKGARVSGSMNPTGTATLAGRDLDPDAAVAAMARVDALAAALRAALAARGVNHLLAWLRARVYLRLLDGSAAGADDATLLADLLDDLTPPDGPDAPDPGGPDDGGPDDGGPDDGGPDDGGPDDDGPDDDGPDGGPDGEAGSEDEPDTHGGEVNEPEQLETEDDAPAGERGVRRGAVELRLRLSTLLGLDDRPAEVPTWGWFTAAVARRMAGERHAGEWRLVVTDDHGRLRHVFLLRRRPPRPRRPGSCRRWGRTSSVHRRAVVELHAPTTLLAALDPDDHPELAAILREARTRLLEIETGVPAHPATTHADATRRRARAELDRWVRTRDRTCLGVGCRRPAREADLDHTRDWAHDGITVAANLGALCRHCHRLKHHGGWSLTQYAPGHFHWSSRAGAEYDIAPRPATPCLPDPRPRADGTSRTPVQEHVLPAPLPPGHPDHHRDDTPAWTGPGAPISTVVRTPARRSDQSDEPPF